MQKIFLLTFAGLMMLNFQSCDNAKSVLNKAGESLDNVNLFTYKDDIELGNQVKTEIVTILKPIHFWLNQAIKRSTII
jgi:hypothetical protein